MMKKCSTICFSHFPVLLSVKEQLLLLSQTDIIIAMHGAALALDVFMPPGGGVIEITTANIRNVNWHMEAIAKWTGHIFQRYMNKNVDLEERTENDKVLSIEIIPDKIIETVQEVSRTMCVEKLKSVFNGKL